MENNFNTFQNGWQLSQDQGLTIGFVIFCCLFDILYMIYLCYKIPTKKDAYLLPTYKHSNVKIQELFAGIKSEMSSDNNGLSAEKRSLISKDKSSIERNDRKSKWITCPSVCICERSPFVVLNLFETFCGILGFSFVITFGLNVFLEYVLAFITSLLQMSNGAAVFFSVILYLFVLGIVIKFVVFIYKESMLAVLLLWYNVGDLEYVFDCNCKCFIKICKLCGAGKHCERCNRCCDICWNCDCMCCHCYDKCWSNMEFQISAGLLWRLMHVILHIIITSINAVSDNADVC